MVDDYNTINIYQYNETYVQVDAEPSLIAEFSEYFTFEAKNARFHPKVKAKVWDGRIRLLNKINKTIYKGLLPYIADYCKDRGYTLNLEPSLIEEYDNLQFEVDTLIEDVSPAFPPREYQKEAVKHAIKSNRCLLLSPTSSGKSFIIYLMSRYYLEQGKRILLVVPSTQLVEQMHSDFKEYQPSFDIDSLVHKIYAGASKTTDKPLVISTWQSIYDQPSSYFNSFDVVIVDEAHNYKGEEVRKVLESATDVKYRIGLTGTLDGVDIHKYTIEGLLGKSYIVTTTRELIDEGNASNIKIKSIVLEYPDHIRAKYGALDYQSEMDFIIGYDPRNVYISKLAYQLSQKNTNTLILCDRIEHCDTLYNKISQLTSKVFQIDGRVSVARREQIRKMAETENGIIIVATSGSFSTGVNIKNLQNIIFAFAGKSFVRILQAIGRTLRLDGKTNTAYLYDIIDDLGRISKKGIKKENYLYKHGIERLMIYTKSLFEYKIIKNKIG